MKKLSGLLAITLLAMAMPASAVAKVGQLIQMSYLNGDPSNNPFSSQYVRSPSISDINGIPTGFTNRLPGSGSSLSGNDSNLSIANGFLNIKAQSGSVFSDQNLNQLDLLCVPFHNDFLADTEAGYFYMLPRFTNVTLAANEQVGVFFGTDVDNFIMFGLQGIGNTGNIQPYSQAVINGVAVSVPKAGSAAVPTYNSGANVAWYVGRGLAAKDPNLLFGASNKDVSTNGIQTFDWAASSSQLPTIATAPLLYAGIYHFGDPNSVVTMSSFFLLYNVPEPSTFVLCLIGIVVASTSQVWRASCR